MFPTLAVQAGLAALVLGGLAFHERVAARLAALDEAAAALDIDDPE